MKSYKAAAAMYNASAQMYNAAAQLYNASRKIEVKSVEKPILLPTQRTPSARTGQAYSLPTTQQRHGPHRWDSR